MNEIDKAGLPAPASWTTSYRLPIAVTTGILALLCCWALSAGGVTEKWAGGIGLAVLIAWVFVYQALRRRGHWSLHVKRPLSDGQERRTVGR